MKARVKYNNEIIDIVQVGTKTHLFDLNNVEFLDNPQDYWARLEHQAAIAAMQGILSNPNIAFNDIKVDTVTDVYVDNIIKIAHALVEKMKEEK